MKVFLQSPDGEPLDARSELAGRGWMSGRATNQSKGRKQRENAVRVDTGGQWPAHTLCLRDRGREVSKPSPITLQIDSHPCHHGSLFLPLRFASEHLSAFTNSPSGVHHIGSLNLLTLSCLFDS